MKNKKVWLIMVALLLIVGLAACSSTDEGPAEQGGDNGSQTETGGEQNGSAQFGGNLVVGTVADPDTLNPLVSNTTPGNWVHSLLYPSLMTMSPEGVKVPYLAESIETSEDGLEIAIKLREGLKWQDGEPITAHDVKFTGELLHEYQLQWTADIFNEVESAEVVDDLTLVYRLGEPYPAFAGTVGYWVRIVPKHIWENVDNPAEFTNDNPVAAGPFKLKHWERGQYIEFESVDEWFAAPEGRPYLDTVTFRIFPDVNTMVLALQRGDVHVTASDIPPAAAANLEQDQNIEVVQTPSLGYSYYSFQLDADKGLLPTQDPNFRLAMVTATDRETILNIALEGSGIHIDTPVSPVYSEWINPDATAPSYNIEQARAILEEAGYADTDGDGILNAPAEYGGENVVIQLMYDAASIQHQRVAQILEQNAREIGVALVLEPLEYNTMISRWNEGNFEMHIGNWGTLDEPSDNLWTLFYSANPLNRGGLNSPEFDEIITAARHATSQQEAIEKVKEAQAWFVEQYPAVPIYVQTFNLAYSTQQFEGFITYPGILQGLVDPLSLVNVRLK